MKFKKIKLLFCSLFIGLTSLVSCSSTSNNENLSNGTNNNGSSEVTTDKTKLEEVKTNLNATLNESYSYSFLPSSISINEKKNNQNYKLDISYGNIVFNDDNSSTYNISFDYKTKNNEKTDLLLNHNGDNSSSIKYKDSLFKIKTSEELPILFNFESLNNKNKKTISFKSDNLSISYLINEALTSINNESTLFYNSLLNEYSLSNDIYNINVDASNYTLTNISTAKNKNLNYDLDLNFKAKAISNSNDSNNESSLINETNSNDLITTLTELVANSSFKTVFDFKITTNDSIYYPSNNQTKAISNTNNDLTNKDYHFYGDINFDLTNSDLIDNSKIELNLKHYTNKDLSNDLSVRYDNTNIYFRSGDLIKGKIKEETISSLIDAISLISDDTSFSSLINNPLNNLFNNKTFKSVTSGSIDITNLGSYIKDYSIRNNVIDLTLDAKAFNLPSDIFNLKIGLNNLKLKTIEISDFKLNDNQVLNGNMRFIDDSSFSLFNENEYPSYDFLPGTIKSIYKLTKYKKLGGNLALNVTNKEKGSNLGISTKLNSSLTNIKDINNIEELKNADLALNNLNINSNGEINLNELLTINSLVYQKNTDFNDENTIYLDITLGNAFQDLALKMGLSDTESLKDLINKFIKPTTKNGEYSSINSIFDISSITNKISTYIDKIMNNERLINDLNKVINDFSLSNLESLIDIYSYDHYLEIRIDYDYLFGNDLTTPLLKTRENSSSNTISLTFDKVNEKFSGLYLNINDNGDNLEFLFNNTTFNEEAFVSAEEDKAYIDAAPIIENIDTITNNPTLNINNIYDIDIKNIPGGINFNEAKVGIAKESNGDLYSEGIIDVNVNENTSLNFEFIYDDKNYNDENFSLGYYDGHLIFNDPNSDKDNLIFPEGELQAEITLNNTGSPLHLITKTSSPFNIFSQFLNIDKNNVLYTFKDQLVTLLDELFSSDYKLISMLINGEYLKLLDKNIIPIHDLEVNEIGEGKNYKLTLEINPEYLNEDYENVDNQNIKVTLDLNIIENQIEINSLTFDATNTKAFNIDDFYLSINSEGKFKHDNPTTNGYYIFKDDQFEKRNDENKTDFVNLDDCINLFSIGINTTENHYFELQGELNITKLNVLGFIDLKIIDPKLINAKIELLSDNPGDFYSRTTAHVSIRNNSNLETLNNDSFLVEFFTRRINEGSSTQEICYISKLINKSYINSYTSIISSTKKYSLNGNLENVLQEENPNSSISKKLLPRTNNFNYDESAARSFADSINNEIKLGYNIASVKSSGFLFKTWRVELSQDVYEYSIDIIEKIPNHNEYQIETFKLTQQELLGTCEGYKIPNIIYYLMDYSLVAENAFMRKLVFIQIYQNINEAEDSGTTTPSDIFGSLNNFVTNDYNEISNKGSFSMNFDLSKLISMEGLNSIDLTLEYKKENGEFILDRLYIDGSNLATGLKKFVDIGLTLNITLKDSGYSSEGKMLRYQNFIKAFDDSVQTNTLNYFKITGYSFSILARQTVSTNNEKTTVTIRDYKKDAPEYGFIYGLN